MTLEAIDDTTTPRQSREITVFENCKESLIFASKASDIDFEKTFGEFGFAPCKLFQIISDFDFLQCKII